MEVINFKPTGEFIIPKIFNKETQEEAFEAVDEKVYNYFSNQYMFADILYDDSFEAGYKKLIDDINEMREATKIKYGRYPEDLTSEDLPNLDDIPEEF